MSNDLAQLKAEIDEMYTLIKEGNHYTILGVKQDADIPAIGLAYRQLTKKWHVDKFITLDLGEEHSKVREIFAAINDANRILSNKEKRQEYDDENEEIPDVGSILEAESFFRRGKNMMKTGAHKGAFEAFKRAYELAPDEVEYRANFLYSEFLLSEKNDKGEVLNKQRATEIFRELDEISLKLTGNDWLLGFMGTVAIGLGQEKKAESLLREASYANPNNHDVKRQLRLIDMRKNKKETFVEKLKGMFNKK